MSIFGGFGSRDSTSLVAVIASTSTPIGTLIKNTHSHPRPSVNTPPANGPSANDAPIVAPYAANAFARSAGERNALLNSANDTANISAAPSPWTARAPIRKSIVPDAAAAAELTVNTVTP